MKRFLFVLLSLLVTWQASAQNRENVWMFGENAGVQYTPGYAIPDTVGTHDLMHTGCASICNRSGRLLFYTNGYKVFDSTGHPFPAVSSGFLISWTGYIPVQSTCIVPFQLDSNKYYVFTMSEAGQLFYSVVDMTLHGGLGDIVPGKMGLLLGTGYTEKMAAAEGCNNIWLVVRSRTANTYYAYEIARDSIFTTPVASACGSLPTAWYRQGVIKFSPDGSKMAAACNIATYDSTLHLGPTPDYWFPIFISPGGVELYDFDRRTGIVSNARVLDSSSYKAYYYGVCFSPDNSILYATTSSSPNTHSLGFSYWYPGLVHQFNLSLGSTSAIAASNTIVFTESTPISDNLGELKRGKDGKIYFGAGAPVTPAFNGYLHRIEFPNTAGMGCTPVANAVNIGPGRYAYRGLPADIVQLPLPDTVYQSKNVVACFVDSIVLTADTGKFYQWQNGQASRAITVHQPGAYMVAYINAACNYETDTFHVVFSNSIPAAPQPGYSCPGLKQGVLIVKQKTGDTTSYTYTWQNPAGDLLHHQVSRHGDTLTGLDTGSYKIFITSSLGCDTVFYAHVSALPAPTASFGCDSIVCRGAEFTISNLSTDAAASYWRFGDGDTAHLSSPAHKYMSGGTYDITLVTTNIEGCTDTLVKAVSVRALNLTVSVDDSMVNKGTSVSLTTDANGPYHIYAWLPERQFPNQYLLNQSLVVDTNYVVTVYGKDGLGCTDSATVNVWVNPEVFMPSAFSPNGDGLNDVFRPRAWGGEVRILFFQVYNRWGQLVYDSYGYSINKGWDGTFGGQPCDVGTYFYTIQFFTSSGKQIAMKGDVTLIR